jgi:hypothetical protein
MNTITRNESLVSTQRYWQETERAYHLSGFTVEKERKKERKIALNYLTSITPGPREN